MVIELYSPFQDLAQAPKQGRYKRHQSKKTDKIMTARLDPLQDTGWLAREAITLDDPILNIRNLYRILHGYYEYLISVALSIRISNIFCPDLKNI